MIVTQPRHREFAQPRAINALERRFFAEKRAEWAIMYTASVKSSSEKRVMSGRRSQYVYCIYFRGSSTT